MHVYLLGSSPDPGGICKSLAWQTITDRAPRRYSKVNFNSPLIVPLAELFSRAVPLLSERKQNSKIPLEFNSNKEIFNQKELNFGNLEIFAMISVYCVLLMTKVGNYHFPHVILSIKYLSFCKFIEQIYHSTKYKFVHIFVIFFCKKKMKCTLYVRYFVS